MNLFPLKIFLNSKHKQKDIFTYEQSLGGEGKGKGKGKGKEKVKGKDVLPHSTGEEYAASPAPLWPQPPREYRLQAHERCRGHLQVCLPRHSQMFLNLFHLFGP